MYNIDLEKGKVDRVLRKGKEKEALNSLDGWEGIVIGGSEGGRLELFDIRVGKCVSSLLADKEGVDAVCFHFEKSLASTGSGKGALRTWELRRLRCLFETTCHKSKWGRGVNRLVQHPSTPAMMSCGADGVLNLFC
jgi:striatin 1/3/4